MLLKRVAVDALSGFGHFLHDLLPVLVNITKCFAPILEGVWTDVRQISIGILVSTDLSKQQQFTVTPLSGQQMHETEAGGVSPVA